VVNVVVKINNPFSNRGHPHPSRFCRRRSRPDPLLPASFSLTRHLQILQANHRLNVAYLLKESFGQLWDYRREAWARRFFRELEGGT